MMVGKSIFHRSRILAAAEFPIKLWSLRVVLCDEAEKLDKISHHGSYAGPSGWVMYTGQS